MLRAIIEVFNAIAQWLTFKHRVDSKLDSVITMSKEMKNELERRILKLEIVAAIDRNDRAVVHQLFDEYKAMGGNSYIQELYKDYCRNPKKRSKKC